MPVNVVFGHAPGPAVGDRCVAGMPLNEGISETVADREPGADVGGIDGAIIKGHDDSEFPRLRAIGFQHEPVAPEFTGVW